MTPRDAMFSILHHETVRPVPYQLLMEDDVAHRLDAHYGDATWRQRLIPYIVGVGAVDTDLKTPIDETHVQDAYGGIWRVDRRPWHLEHTPLSEASWGDYVFPTAEKFFRPDWKQHAYTTIAETPDSFHIGNLGWGLFERSWNLRGFENALMDIIAEPDFFEEMLDKLTELYLQFVAYTIDLPIDGILFGDDWGDQRGVIIGAERWRKFLKPRWARIYEAVHAQGKFVMSHSCGSVAEIIPDLIEIGLDVLESVQPEAAGMNPYGLKQQWGDKITFWGSLGSQSIIPFGSPQQLTQEIYHLADEMGCGGGYILSPAKPLQPETPTENAVAIFEAFTSLG
ncbi:MAG TPA: uroporphyrinogen decarboxylase family protein [Armatimonadota bacterium]|nr:uroporphyrinogen decarboxylase family protein [Armatimonadota bacterium]